MSRESSGSFFSFVVGGLIGAGAALLFATKTGKETREQLKEIAKTVEEQARKQLEEAKEKASNELDKLQEKAKSSLEEGKEVFREEMAKTEKVDENENKIDKN